MEPTINLSLNATEIQNLGEMLDIAIKATGVGGAKKALPLYAKLEQAVAEANKKTTQENE